MNLFFVYLVAVNSLLFIFMCVDKYKAIKHRYRIPESWLLSLGLLGGGLGGWLSLLIFRHKIRKMYFKVVFSAGLLVMLYIYWRIF
ncbi:DUF1294 domain-containing protein [Aerococcaceae bacterium zg-BR22]|uniref:DUF1294 domain-containing protein n=1 Tax=Aerococcaceae bacterium zg-1292 TaxID=2774330 RepID=UPI004062BEA4|nr:DUF1294 domain-containing protein [Aerococcaceae bacterium zg-BR22]